MNRFKTKPQRQDDRSQQESRRDTRQLKPLEDLTAYVQEYARQRPESVALACIGVGFILGWKLKLW